MDDKEYYTLMNRSSSWALQQALKKKKTDSQKKIPQANSASSSTINSTLSTESYKSLEARQGRADAEMLMEKK